MPFLRSCREPVLAELGHPDVASGRDSYASGLPRVMALGTLYPSSAPTGDPSSQSSDTLMSLPEGIATPVVP